MLTVINRGRVVFSGTVDELRKRASAAIHALRTSDDRRGARPGAGRPGVKVVPGHDGGLEVSADTDALDAYVIALGARGRRRPRAGARARSLESLFLELTGHADAGQATAVGIRRGADSPRRIGGGLVSIGGVASRGRRRVLQARGTAQGAGGACARASLGPFAFAASDARAEQPADRHLVRPRRARSRASRSALVVLGFAALWAFPVLTSVVGGDIFSAEDRYGTWKTVLTRSRSRAEVFTGKVARRRWASPRSRSSSWPLSSIAAGVLVVGPAAAHRSVRRSWFRSAQR